MQTFGQQCEDNTKLNTILIQLDDIFGKKNTKNENFDMVLDNLARAVPSPRRNEDGSVMEYLTPEDLPVDVRFWYELRFIHESQHIDHIYKFFIESGLIQTPNVGLKTVYDVAQYHADYFNNYQYSHLTYADSNDKTY
eukprot:UN02541